MVGTHLSDLTQNFPALDDKALALLKQIGVTSLVSLISLPIERLSGLLNLPFHSADQLRQSLIEQYCPAPLSGLSVYQVRFTDQLSLYFMQISFDRQHQIHPYSLLGATHLMQFLVEG